MQFLINKFVKLLEVEDKLTRAEKRVSESQEIRNGRPHRFVVFRKDCLEDWEIILCHLVDYFIKSCTNIGLNAISTSRVSIQIEHWRLECLCYHIIAIENLTGKNWEDGVDLFVEDEPEVLQFEKLTHQKVFMFVFSIFTLWWDNNLILIVFSHWEVGNFIIRFDDKAFIGIRLNNSDVVLLRNLYFNAYCLLSLRIIIVREMNTYDPCDEVFVFLVFPEKVLDVFVLSKRELCKRQNRVIEFECV